MSSTDWAKVAGALAVGAVFVALFLGGASVDRKTREVEIEQAKQQTIRYQTCVKYHTPKECEDE